MQLETDRLTLMPLTARQMWLWVKDIPTLEKELNGSYQAQPLEGVLLEGVFRKIVETQAKKTDDDEACYLYHTFWFLIRKSDRVIVGSADFKDVPDRNGEVEIGYGLGKAFEHHGYMTEAVNAMCEWVLGQERVSHVIAETDRDNAASQAILNRCGFSLYRQGDTCWWRL